MSNNNITFHDNVISLSGLIYLKRKKTYKRFAKLFKSTNLKCLPLKIYPRIFANALQSFYWISGSDIQIKGEIIITFLLLVTFCLLLFWVNFGLIKSYASRLTSLSLVSYFRDLHPILHIRLSEFNWIN